MAVVFLILLAYLCHSVGTVSSTVPVITMKMYLFTECSSGLRQDEDRLILAGHLNVTGVSHGAWSHSLHFILGSKQSDSILCHVDLRKCNSSSGRSGCYCSQVSPHFFSVILNLTASEALSQNVIRLVWPQRDSNKLISSQPQQVPRVFKPDKEVTTLLENFENVTVKRLSCKLATRNTPSYIEYCCIDSPSPCQVKLQSQGSVIHGSPCLVGSFVVVHDAIYSFSHSVCGRESPNVITCVGAKNLNQGQESRISFNTYRNAAIFLAATIAIGLIIATVHHIDASILFGTGSQRKAESAIRRY